MKTQIKQNIKAIVLALVLVAGVSYVSAAWTAPTELPTGGNVPAPINVGGGDVGITPYSQIKTGALTLMHLFTPDLTVTNSDGTVSGIPDGSVLIADGANTGKVKWGTVSGGDGVVGVINAYSANLTTKSIITSSSWTDSGLAITLTPSSISSKFLINANIVAINGNSPGDCFVGLFKDNNELVVPFSASDESVWAAKATGVTYIDNAGSTNSRTYKIKVKGNGGSCYINRSEGLETYDGASTMTIIEMGSGSVGVTPPPILGGIPCSVSDGFFMGDTSGGTVASGYYEFACRNNRLYSITNGMTDSNRPDQSSGVKTNVLLPTTNSNFPDKVACSWSGSVKWGNGTSEVKMRCDGGYITKMFNASSATEPTPIEGKIVCDWPSSSFITNAGPAVDGRHDDVILLCNGGEIKGVGVNMVWPF
jgi:hypothetical protein